MRQRTVLSLLSGISLLAVSACGETVGEQAIIGAAAGGAATAVAGGSVAAGAAIGAGANLLYCQTNPSKCN